MVRKLAAVVLVTVTFMTTLTAPAGAPAPPVTVRFHDLPAPSGPPELRVSSSLTGVMAV